MSTKITGAVDHPDRLLPTSLRLQRQGKERGRELSPGLAH
ncbi:hypothetical protein GWL_36450 [Herbaspirillum sp. GW103]|nr:hypothetical protein GWL_36450 [Herbaspirillum sp. GW103]